MTNNDSSPSSSRGDYSDEFVRLLTLHHSRIFSFIFALLPNVADAEEIMQETSLVLWRKFSEAQEVGDFRAWAFSVARFKVLEFRRSNPQRGHLELCDDLIEQVALLAEKKIDVLEQRRRALTNCVNKLGAKDRDLIERRTRAGATMTQISQEVSRPVAGLYKAFQRIYGVLHECIDRTLAQESGHE